MMELEYITVLNTVQLWVRIPLGVLLIVISYRAMKVVRKFGASLLNLGGLAIRFTKEDETQTDREGEQFCEVGLRIRQMIT